MARTSVLHILPLSPALLLSVITVTSISVLSSARRLPTGPHGILSYEEHPEESRSEPQATGRYDDFRRRSGGVGSAVPRKSSHREEADSWRLLQDDSGDRRRRGVLANSRDAHRERRRVILPRNTSHDRPLTVNPTASQGDRQSVRQHASSLHKDGRRNTALPAKSEQVHLRVCCANSVSDDDYLKIRDCFCADDVSRPNSISHRSPNSITSRADDRDFRQVARLGTEKDVFLRDRRTAADSSHNNIEERHTASSVIRRHRRLFTTPSVVRENTRENGRSDTVSSSRITRPKGVINAKLQAGFLTSPPTKHLIHRHVPISTDVAAVKRTNRDVSLTEDLWATPVMVERPNYLRNRHKIPIGYPHVSRLAGQFPHGTSTRLSSRNVSFAKCPFSLYDICVKAQNHGLRPE